MATRKWKRTDSLSPNNTIGFAWNARNVCLRVLVRGLIRTSYKICDVDPRICVHEINGIYTIL